MQGGVKAQVYIALGMVASQLGQGDEARPISRTPGQRLQREAAGPRSDAEHPSAVGRGGASQGRGRGGRGLPDESSLVGRIPKAFKLASEGLRPTRRVASRSASRRTSAALEIEEQPRTRLHLASCESRNGKLVDALKDAQKALEAGIPKRDAGVMKVARTRVKELLERIPHVTFVAPAGRPGHLR